MSFDPKIKADRLPVESLHREKRSPEVPAGPGGPAFDAVLRERVTGLKFSAHAEERMRKRGIAPTVEELEKLGTGVQRAEAKGCRDSLVVVNDKAFVVSVKNKTVITALQGSNVKEGVFTNIDSAVVM